MARTFNFDRETGVSALGDGRYESRLDRAWWVHRGPNGGYLAAIVLRALTDAVGDPSRSPRSLTVHYAAPPADGVLEIATRIERAGRSLTSCSARLTQDGTLIGLALGAFSLARPGPEFSDLRPPAAPPVEETALIEPPADDPWIPDIAFRWENRIVRGGFPLESTGEAVITRWIRLPEGRVVDAPVAAAITDAVIPAVFGRVEEEIIVPTRRPHRPLPLVASPPGRRARRLRPRRLPHQRRRRGLSRGGRRDLEPGRRPPRPEPPTRRHPPDAVARFLRQLRRQGVPC
jgi:Thioesterase-like superfamily